MPSGPRCSKLAFGLALISAVASCAIEQEVKPREAARPGYKMCRVIDRLQVASKPCFVSSPYVINLTVPFTAAEADSFCGELRREAVRSNLSFESFWTVRFYSTYSANGPLYTCDLG